MKNLYDILRKKLEENREITKKNKSNCNKGYKF